MSAISKTWIWWYVSQGSLGKYRCEHLFIIVTGSLNYGLTGLTACKLANMGKGTGVPYCCKSQNLNAQRPGVLMSRCRRRCLSQFRSSIGNLAFLCPVGRDIHFTQPVIKIQIFT
jgi:hypothetical protein